MTYNCTPKSASQHAWKFINHCLHGVLTEICLFNTYTARPVCWSGWISDSYCSLKNLCSGMGEVVPARTSLTLLPHPLALCCHYPVSKCRSASIVATGTVSVKNRSVYKCRNLTFDFYVQTGKYAITR